MEIKEKQMSNRSGFIFDTSEMWARKTGLQLKMPLILCTFSLVYIELKPQKLL